MATDYPRRGLFEQDFSELFASRGRDAVFFCGCGVWAL